MKILDNVVGSFTDYPLSWTYAISMTAFQPFLSEFIPILNQVLLLLMIHLVTIFVDWLRKKLKVPRKEQKDKMDIVKDLEDVLLRRKDVRKEAREK